MNELEKEWHKASDGFLGGIDFKMWLANQVLALRAAVQQGVQLTGLHCPECGVLSFAGESCEQCGFPYLRPATNASRWLFPSVAKTR